MPLFKFLPGVEFLKGVFNFNLFTKVPVLVSSCLLETPTPNWDALFTDCTIELSNSSPFPTTISLFPVTRSPTVEFGTLKCYADFLTDISPPLTHFTALSNDDIVIFWSFSTLNILEKKPALINKKTFQ